MVAELSSSASPSGSREFTAGDTSPSPPTTKAMEKASVFWYLPSLARLLTWELQIVEGEDKTKEKKIKEEFETEEFNKT